MRVADAVELLLAFGRDNDLGFITDTASVWAMVSEHFADSTVEQLDPAALEEFCVEAGFDREQAAAWFQAKREAWSAAYDSEDYLRKWGARTPCDVLRRYYAGCSRPPRRALDLGCGDGVNAIFMASQGTEVDAVDLAPAAIERLGRRADEAGMEVRGYVGSVHDLPGGQSEYDLVFDRGCFHHVPVVFWHLYQREVLARLAPGGTLLLMCHTPKVFPDRYVGLFLGCFGRLVQFLCDGRAESSFSARDLVAIFGSRFEIVGQDRVPDHEGKPFAFNVCTMRRPLR